MDRQLEFLQVWASACQPIVTMLFDDIKAMGFEAAHIRFMHRCEDFLKTDHELSVMGEQESFAYWMVVVAHMYIDLMARYGVFDDDPRD
jgi:hypothetical protein